MEIPDFRYEQYPGGEVASEIDGMTAHALEALRAYLRKFGVISRADDGEQRFVVGPYGSDEFTWSLTAKQLDYLMTSEDHLLNYLLADQGETDEPVTTPEQNHEEMMLLFNEVLAKYPASAFTALCPRPALPAEPTHGLFRRRKETAKEASPPSNVVHRRLETNTINYDVTVRYREDSSTRLYSAEIYYNYGQVILWFGEHGIADAVSIDRVIPSIGDVPDYSKLVALRKATAGTDDISGTRTVLDGTEIGGRSEAMYVSLAYGPELHFGYLYGAGVRDASSKKIARYQAKTNQFILEIQDKNPKQHAFSVESAAKMLDEILSTLPVRPQPVLHNHESLR